MLKNVKYYGILICKILKINLNLLINPVSVQYHTFRSSPIRVQLGLGLRFLFFYQNGNKRIFNCIIEKKESYKYY
jgi:hypothetical protein